MGAQMNTNNGSQERSPLTKKQTDFLSFLKEYFRERGYPPTVREIMDGLGLSSTNVVRKYLKILERKGYVKRQFHSPRAIEIVDIAGESSEGMSVPIVGRVRAGTPHPVIEDVEGYLLVDKAICGNNTAFFMRVVGDSMIDAHIQEGDLVLIKPQPIANNGEIVVALVDNEATVKRFYQKGDTVQLKPENPVMKPIIIRQEDAHVSIVGRVVAVLRQTDRSKNTSSGKWGKRCF